MMLPRVKTLFNTVFYLCFYLVLRSYFLYNSLALYLQAEAIFFYEGGAHMHGVNFIKPPTLPYSGRHMYSR